MHLGGLVSVVVVFLNAAQAATAPSLPADPRLEPVRARLETIVSRAAEAGLPADLVVSKVREGLAKGVPPARIEVAAARLAESLESARRYVAERRSAPAPALVRALAEARIAGLELGECEAIVRSDRTPGDAARAVEVLTDLSLRGYPSARTSPVVKDVLARDPGAVPRLPAALETIRVEQALTHVETVDALSRGLAGSETLQAAYARTLDDERRKGNGKGQGKQGPGKDGHPGKDGFVPPGQLKKETTPAKQGRGAK